MGVSVTAVLALAIIVSNMLVATSQHKHKGEGGLDFLDMATLILAPLGVLFIALFAN